MRKRFDIVLLDADETIFDFKRAEAHALRRSMEAFGFVFNEARLKLYSDINLACWKAMERGELKRDRLTSLRFEKFFEAMGGRVPDCAAFHVSYVHNLAEAGFLLDGALEFLKKLHEHCRIYIATNGLTIAQRGRFKRSAIQPYVDDIFISEEIGAQKPTKEYFDHIFNTIGVEDRSRVIMLGDSLTSDMQGGRNAGVTTCRYLGDHPHEDSDLIDYEITSYDEFFNILFQNKK